MYICFIFLHFPKAEYFCLNISEYLSSNLMRFTLIGQFWLVQNKYSFEHLFIFNSCECFCHFCTVHSYYIHTDVLHILRRNANIVKVFSGSRSIERFNILTCVWGFEKVNKILEQIVLLEVCVCIKCKY